MTDDLLARAKAALEGVSDEEWFNEGARVRACADLDEPLNIADCDMDQRIGYDLRAVPNAAFIAFARNNMAEIIERWEKAEAEKALLRQQRDDALAEMRSWQDQSRMKY